MIVITRVQQDNLYKAYVSDGHPLINPWLLNLPDWLYCEKRSSGVITGWTLRINSNVSSVRIRTLQGILSTPWNDIRELCSPCTAENFFDELELCFVGNREQQIQKMDCHQYVCMFYFIQQQFRSHYIMSQLLKTVGLFLWWHCDDRDVIDGWPKKRIHPRWIWKKSAFEPLQAEKAHE